jgi:hypothetical protein
VPVAAKKAKVTGGILAALFMTFSLGYYLGRAASTNWDDENTAFLYICRASHRAHATDGTLLVLALPDVVYRYNGKSVEPIPNAVAIARERYPTVGGEEYDQWLNGVVTFGDIASTKGIWDLVNDSGEVKGLARLSTATRVIIALATVGSFAAGYGLGHRSKPNFDAPKFRSALLNPAVWQQVWTYKRDLQQAADTLNEQKAGIRSLEEVDHGQKNQDLTALKNHVQEELQRLDQQDPDLLDNAPSRTP